MFFLTLDQHPSRYLPVPVGELLLSSMMEQEEDEKLFHVNPKAIYTTSFCAVIKYFVSRGSKSSLLAQIDSCLGTLHQVASFIFQLNCGSWGRPDIALV